MLKNKVRCCLLVEDDPEDQEFFIDTLQKVSPDTGCYAVANGEDALFALLQEDLKPDYIFTDLNMAGMGGFEFMKALNAIERLKDIPIVVYTSYYSEDMLKTVKNLGATAIYSKTRLDFLQDILKKYFTEPPAKPTTTILL